MRESYFEITILSIKFKKNWGDIESMLSTYDESGIQAVILRLTLGGNSYNS